MDGQVAYVHCSWIGSSAPHTISASITLGDGSSEKFINLGSSMAAGTTSAGGLSVSAPELPMDHGSSPDDPCMFTPIEVNEATRSVWGQFTCGIFTDEGGTDSCAIGTSYYAFENCSPP